MMIVFWIYGMPVMIMIMLMMIPPPHHHHDNAFKTYYFLHIIYTHTYIQGKKKGLSINKQRTFFLTTKQKKTTSALIEI